MKNRANSAQKQLHSDPPFFPSAEAPSFCSRPTPVVPANDDVRQYPTDYPPKASGEFAIGTPSSRPTYCPDDPELSLRQTLLSEDLLAAVIERATINPELTPSAATPSALDFPAPAESPELAVAAPAVLPVLASEARPRRRAARAVFVVLFGSTLMMLGYSFSPRLAVALHALRATVMGQTAH